MSYIKINGGRRLYGELTIQGSKNASLPILAGVLLCRGTTILHNCPKISDVKDTLLILRHLGCIIKEEKDALLIDSSQLLTHEVQDEEAGEMRSSVMFLGALIGRCRKAVVCHPGGCTIGNRPIDMHMAALQQLGVEIEEQNNMFYCNAERLTGANITFQKISVGATENSVLASVLAEGTTVLKNAATEPEIVALCKFLRKCGAKISGEGTRILQITGVEKLSPCEFTIPTDRIVAGTYLMAAAAVGGCIRLNSVNPDEMYEVLEVLKNSGCRIETEPKTILMKAPTRLKPVLYLETAAYPGFPTDMQSQLAVAMTVAEGISVIRETIFERRFRIISELTRMGASIEVSDDMMIIEGRSGLLGTTVTANELRGAAALLIAGMLAEGTTIVNQTQYLFRGYQDMIGDMNCLGADLCLIDTPGLTD